MNTVVTYSCSPEETERVGAMVAKALGEQRFVAFYGNLGAGKTAFVRGMASVLCPDAPVQSPTYAIINEYKNNGRTVMVHVDAYRVNDDDDLYSTGFYDCLDYEDCVCAVEWSEKIPFAIPEDAVRVNIEYYFDGGEPENNGDFSQVPANIGKRRIAVENLKNSIEIG